MAGMEIRIDSVEGQATPKDTFVSMRVGDYQKQSRFGSAKTYRFPQTEDEHRFARIEVFHRIGHLTVNLDNLSANEPLEVPVDLPEVKLLPMKLAILNDTVDTKTEQKAKQQKAKNKVDAAQKYLSEHHVEEVIADAIREVIHEKPSDPHAFLSEQILKHAAKKKEEMLERDNQVITNDVVDHSAVKLEPPANVQSAAPASKPTVSMLPFRDYYVFHCLPASSNPMENLYGKFAKTEKKSTSEAPKPEVVAQTEKTSTSEAKKPEVVAVTQVSSPPEFVPFAKRPSVGTWLNSAPKKKAPGVEAPKEVSVKEAPKVQATAVTTEVTTEVTPFFKRPSVGTWLMAAPKKSSEEQKAPIASAKPEAVAPAASEPTPKAETQAAKPVKETPPTLPFREYYATHMSPMPAMESIYAKFPSQPKSAPKAADTEAVKEAPKVQATAVTTEVTTEVTPFFKRPSVGTWLMAAPKKSSEEQKAPAAVAKPEAVVAVAETKPATPTPKFQHLPSVATWLCAAPLRKAPAVAPSILDRSRSRIVAMEKEEIVDAVVMEIKQKEQAFQCQIKKKEEEFASELLKKDEEIARLKALLSK